MLFAKLTITFFRTFKKKKILQIFICNFFCFSDFFINQFEQFVINRIDR